ncbi:CCA tRNA nucleotidyltransferase [Bdellovibrio bacteriovorus]|uniref:CCA tRNA nucleotidyltransferase n=1 Tax=Bdellovibrio bacteriovorus TaxID=959 RepID=UPI0012FEB7C1|nr:CCA tRNA nucleotidyltransferase [Bdellovibrio bacteriovorus]
MNQVQSLLQSHPHWPAVESIYHRLQAHGYMAFLAGGCVRDALLGVQAHDLDLATNATPEKVESLFSKTVNVGKSFGVMRVLVEGADIEVATFRNDGTYSDGRRPENVVFSSPQEDAQRRDFTVNALFYDLATAQVLDYVEGQKDLKARVLRTVGDAERRFEEDHLRLLRAARFSAQLNFELEPVSFAAVKKMAEKVKSVSGERIREEMTKLLKTEHADHGLQVMKDSGLMKVLFPFRLRKNDWVKNSLATEAWQRLAMFVRSAQGTELVVVLDMLKLSTRDRRAIEDAWKVWQDPQTVLKNSLGKQLQMLAKEGVVFALRILLSEAVEKTAIEFLLAEWKSWQEVLPRPFLNGEDVKGRLTGPAIGVCLDKAFEQQLERQLQSRDEALLWLKKYLERESS